MLPTKCPICEIFGQAEKLYPAKLPNLETATAAFDPRREIDDYHYQMVKCNQCGLVRSDPIFEPQQLARLYLDSKFTYSDEAHILPLNKTYTRYLKKLLRDYQPQKESILDIGCGNGFFLEQAKEVGFVKIAGMEPSRHAIERAAADIKPFIVEGMFKADYFLPAQFDIITCFQTFEHITEPNKFLQDCRAVLKPDGFILIISHNVNSLASRFFKERCPIIDIGHAYLYDLSTAHQIFAKNGFKVLDVFPVKNTIAISYLLELLPLPRAVKNQLKKLASQLKLGQKTVSIYMGNLGLIAQK